MSDQSFGSQVAYVAIVVKNPKRVHDLLNMHLNLVSATLDFEGVPCHSLQLGQTRLVILPQDSPLVGGSARTGVHHMGVASRDPERDSERFGLCTVAPSAEASFNGGRRVAIPLTSTGGMCTYLCDPLPQVRATTDIALRIDHLGVVNESNEVSRQLFCDKLGLEMESFQTDIEAEIPLESFTSNKYGVVYHTRAPRLRAGIRGLFVGIGDFDLEFCESFDPGETSEYKNSGVGHTRQDHSAIARFLASRGAGLHHIAIKVKDINAVLSSLKNAGVNVIDEVGRPGGRRSLIGFLHPSGMDGVLMHFVQHLGRSNEW